MDGEQIERRQECGRHQDEGDDVVGVDRPSHIINLDERIVTYPPVGCAPMRYTAAPGR